MPPQLTYPRPFRPQQDWPQQLLKVIKGFLPPVTEAVGGPRNRKSTPPMGDSPHP